MPQQPLPQHHRARTGAAAALVLALVAIACFYYFVDPASGLMPRCFFHAVTGLQCPGCGFQRALHALLHGNIGEAWHYNPFAFFAVPTGIFYIVTESMRHRWPRFHARAVHPLIIIAITAAILAFWVARNCV